MSEVGTRPVPLGLSEREVDEAIARLTTELGPEKVLTSPEDLREFRDPFQVTTSDASAASAVVMPTTVEEIQAVVAIAQRDEGAAVDARRRAATTATAGPRRACAGRSSSRCAT